MRVNEVKRQTAYNKALLELNSFLESQKSSGKPSQKVITEFSRLEANLELATLFGGL